jgi:hypothetical protein
VVKIGKNEPNRRGLLQDQDLQNEPNHHNEGDNGRAHSTVCGKISSVAHCGDRVIVWTTNEPRRT